MVTTPKGLAPSRSRWPARRTKTLPNLLLLALVSLLSACQEPELGSPPYIELTVPTEGRTGAPVEVGYEAGGRQLSGLIFEWGDGEVDSLATSGAQSASGTARHGYAAPGSYTVVGIAQDAIEGSRRDSGMVRVR